MLKVLKQKISDYDFHTLNKAYIVGYLFISNKHYVEYATDEAPSKNK